MHRRELKLPRTNRRHELTADPPPPLLPFVLLQSQINAVVPSRHGAATTSMQTRNKKTDIPFVSVPADFSTLVEIAASFTLQSYYYCDRYYYE